MIRVFKIEPVQDYFANSVKIAGELFKQVLKTHCPACGIPRVS
jgi:hypothetical protein